MLNSHLEWIDELFSSENKSISSRPLDAAILLINNKIIEFKNIEEDKYYQSEDFLTIIKLIQSWYFKRYGELVKSKQYSNLKGIALFHNNPLHISFPQTTCLIEEEGETSWVIFSTNIEQHENINTYFSSKIDLSSLPKDEYTLLYQTIDRIVYLTRRISINIFSDTTKLDNDEIAMLQSIIRHIEKGIDDILKLGIESSVACWEFHLAIEKSFKVYIKQKSGNKAYGHNLIKLNETSTKYGKEINLDSLKKLPSDQEAIKLRYGELQLPIKEIISIYNQALEIIEDITKDLNRSLKIYNSRVLIKKPGWAW